MSAAPTPVMHRIVDSCRICRSRDLELVVSLGETPLANAFVRPEQVGDPELRFPLDAMRCTRCGLVQLSVVVDPTVMFGTYRYATSSSEPMVAHFERYAEGIVQRFELRGALVVEVGSNDGVMLRPLARLGAHALGIEPASNLAEAANAQGLATLNAFFAVDVAQAIARERGAARAITANNVIAHIDDLRGSIAAVSELLSTDGVFVAEVPYLRELLAQVEYDTIYHEHLSYLSIRPLDRLFSDSGLELFDIEFQEIHGGSIRIFAGRPGRHVVTHALAAARETELREGLDTPGPYALFASRVALSRRALRDLLAKLRSEQKSLAALGATAKGNTLLHYCEVGAADISYVADSTPLKHGLLTPGTHIPIRPEEIIFRDRPDYTLMLAWNYADAIIRKFEGYTRAGGRFIRPIPLAEVLP